MYFRKTKESNRIIIHELMQVPNADGVLTIHKETHVWSCSLIFTKGELTSADLKGKGTSKDHAFRQAMAVVSPMFKADNEVL